MITANLKVATKGTYKEKVPQALTLTLSEKPAEVCHGDRRILRTLKTLFDNEASGIRWKRIILDRDGHCQVRQEL